MKIFNNYDMTLLYLIFLKSKLTIKIDTARYIYIFISLSFICVNNKFNKTYFVITGRIFSD